jgi:AcrR family transcriptional regulator
MPKPKLELTAATRSDARQNRDRLLDAARSVLAKRGFEADVTEIAERAGVGAGTLYRHFPNKEALILEVAREMSNRTVGDLNRIASSIEDARDCLRQTMEVGFLRVKEYGQLTIALVAGTQPPAYDKVVDRLALGNMIAALIYRGIAQGHFRADVDVEYVVAVWFALVSPHSLSQLMQKRSLDEIATSTTEFLLAGLETKPTPADT